MTDLREFPASLQRHAVGFQRVDQFSVGPWLPIPGRSVEAARQQYNDGRVELAQGRTEGGFVLFAIPRQRRIDRPPHQRLKSAPSPDRVLTESAKRLDRARRARANNRVGACV
jgi:hypothetical protein